MIDKVVDALIVDLLEWLASRDRTYREVIDVWRTSCPKLPVWEDANDRGFVVKQNVDGREIIKLTAAGSNFLQRRGASRTNSASPDSSRPS
jgi:D-3-phosphoglycerate dehydrogenase